MKQFRPTRTQLLTYFIVVSLAVLVIATAILYVTVKDKNSALDAPIVMISAEPDTSPISDTYEWRGADTDPKRIILPSLGTTGFIQKVGVDQNGEIAVPTNIHMAGWFVDSVRPGQKGLSIIDGHISTESTTAIFQQLAEIQPDDQFSIEFGDGVRRDFRVFEVVDVSLEDAADNLYSQDPGVERQLNLVTCAGNYDGARETFTRRVIVKAAAL